MNMEATIGGQSSQERFHTVRNNAASIIGNGVISLLWQLRCHCNPDHNKFSSLSNTTVVAIFPNVCLWRRSLCSNLAGIDPEKLYWGNFICIVWPSFLFDCFVKIWATCKKFLGKWFTAPPWPKISRTPMVKVKCPDPGVASHNQKPDMGIVSGIKSPPLARTPPSRDLHW